MQFEVFSIYLQGCNFKCVQSICRKCYALQTDSMDSYDLGKKHRFNYYFTELDNTYLRNFFFNVNL